MIKVLQDWLEIGEASKFLIRKGLPGYPGGEKNWDLYNLYRIVELMPRTIKIVDLGCRGLMALKFLYAMGFRNLYGIDLTITQRERLNQAIRMLRERSLRVPFHLCRGNLTKTKFPNHTFDLAVCTSTIEHGVKLEEFLSESKRILKPEGILFVSTDYWVEEIKAREETGLFGLPHKVFSERDIKHFIELAQPFGFSLYKNSVIPTCSDRCILLNKQEFTFLCMVFKKVK